MSGGLDVNRRSVIVAAILAAAVVKPVHAEDRSVVSPADAKDKVDPRGIDHINEQSGLFDYLLPMFKQKTGMKVRVAHGTGQALDSGRRGDADVVFVHAKAAEEKFLAEGEGVKRIPVMYNDFVLIGPKSDPAKVNGIKDMAKAFRKIQRRRHLSFHGATVPGHTSPNSQSGTRIGYRH